jgi:hypothetical protein
MRLNDQKVRGLPLREIGQRDDADDTVRGLFLRVGTRTKTFMVIIRTPSGRKRVKLGTYPGLTLGKARENARDLLAENPLKKGRATPNVLRGSLRDVPSHPPRPASAEQPLATDAPYPEAFP